MSRKPSFANLRGAPTPAPVVAPAAPTPAAPPPVTGAAAGAGEGAVAAPVPAPAKGPASRQGRKQIAGFFSPEMSLALHMLALRQDRSLQALMAEAFNDVLRKHGESPIGD